MPVDDSFRQLVREEFAAVLAEWMPRFLSQAARRPPRPVRDSDVEKEQDWLSIATVAKRVDRKPRTIRRWIATGKLKTCGPNGHHIDKSELERVMAQGPLPADDDDDRVERAFARVVKK